jgi:hypothetical protein
MSNNMIECPICQFRFASFRDHCPTCGSHHSLSTGKTYTVKIGVNWHHEIVVAHGAERARQLPQSPRVFQLVD